MAEHWLIEGGGHAWFGGSVDGSYTDPLAPMPRGKWCVFFLGTSPAVILRCATLGVLCTEMPSSFIQPVRDRVARSVELLGA